VGDPSEVGISDPNVILGILVDEKSHRPVEPGVGIGGQEQRAKRWIAEHEKRGRAQRDAGIGRELGLINIIEEHDALVGHVFLGA
jgi:hypothetical protein